MGEAGVQVVWFKRDLRLRDHAPLAEAARRGPVLPLYVYEPEQLAHEEFGGHHLSYLGECLRELSDGLASLGAPLVLRRGEVTEVLEGLHAEHPIAGLWSHEETGNGVSFQRDRRVRAWARARGVPMTELPQNGVVRRLRDRDGWAATWEERMTAPIVAGPEQLHGVQAGSCGVLSHAELGVGANTKRIPPGGEAAAHEVLHSFLTVRGVNYMREMSSPVTAEESCSRLSAPLAFGTVSLREVLQATRQRLAQVRGDETADPRWVRSLRSFESRLHWHCHFMQRLESEPAMEVRNLNPAFDGLRPDVGQAGWNAEHFGRYQAGQTGYPLVDACLRMLLETGWLNFRMRAMLMSFSSQLLWLHWRRPGLFLAHHWLDNEPGIHWAQTQMQSSTVGINKVRIYNPTLQAREQDPSGDFIRRWVPELADVPTDFIHAPWEWSGAGRLAYPAPVVDAAAAAREARRRIASVRATPEFEPQARRVYLKHGSRKKADLRAERAARGLAPPSAPSSSKPATRKPASRKKVPPMTDQPDLFGLVPEAPKPLFPTGLPDDWKAALEGEFSAPYFYELRDFLVEERKAHTIYPPAPDVFNALRFTPLSEVKVLILGQDPYHRPGQAHGLSFSVRPGVPVPPSLRNIYKELAGDIPGFTPPKHGFLRAWAEQGVLLLNAVLTVREGQANSHQGKGWEHLTDAIIRAVNAKPDRVVFVLWGSYARKKRKLITGGQHIIIESGHPSPLSETYFFGTRPFSKVNAALEEAGKTPIEWQLPVVAEE
ncbi:Uracil-DNA glycosylase [Deinococcus reticulitermitis]|uniref:Uracil-DNA glycosylase n=2 Tax=Deinococcus reticulitermitis TaxID=856736 RepID=A0A1H6UL69_9DEIO|nr:Uracil-DNA glycosylase [Deinococcus reticulitermitis]